MWDGCNVKRALLSKVLATAPGTWDAYQDRQRCTLGPLSGDPWASPPLSSPQLSLHLPLPS